MKIFAIKWTAVDDKNPETDMSGISLHSTRESAVESVFEDAIFDNLDALEIEEKKAEFEHDGVLAFDDETLFVTINEVDIK